MPPWLKKIVKNQERGENQENERKNWEKIKKKRKNREKAKIGKVLSLCPSWQIGLATLLAKAHQGGQTHLESSVLSTSVDINDMLSQRYWVWVIQHNRVSQTTFCAFAYWILWQWLSECWNRLMENVLCLFYIFNSAKYLFLYIIITWLFRNVLVLQYMGRLPEVKTFCLHQLTPHEFWPCLSCFSPNDKLPNHKNIQVSTVLSLPILHSRCTFQFFWKSFKTMGQTIRWLQLCYSADWGKEGSI